MTSAITTALSENLAAMAFFLSLAFFISWAAFAAGYYKLPFKNFIGPLLSLQDVLSCFFIFITLYFLGLPLVLSIFCKILPENWQTNCGLISHVAIFGITALFLFLYCFTQNRLIMKRVWRDHLFPGSLPFKEETKIGIVFWVIAMPVVTSITYLVEIAVSLITNPTNKEQVAVKFLKDSLTSGPTSAIALFSIIVVAPIFEEFLFRGILLSYLRTKLGALHAIFFSSLVFSLFHYSPTQSIENFALLATLFSFGCYLGFVYEKTRSLYPSILLHVTFNSISVIRIIFTHV